MSTAVDTFLEGGLVRTGEEPGKLQGSARGAVTGCNAMKYCVIEQDPNALRRERRTARRQPLKSTKNGPRKTLEPTCTEVLPPGIEPGSTL